ncbi:uncharacterized protein LOC142340206 isoform X1 [Convolutriloba macropyga]|uniref:uncharacterized protein LOC142340206 isoform X1 n=1 Tax=Convolutriloba macropyga TaxID=536237 RepID=UPI003F525825
MDSDVVHLITCAVMSVVEIVAIVTSSLALGGGNWIESVTGDGDYFTRAESQFSLSYLNSDRIHSIGMWRMFFYTSEQSTPLPLRDSELKMATVLFICSLVCGCSVIVVPSYQVMGVRPRCLILSVAVLWACLFQVTFLLSAVLIVTSYFSTTFSYQSFGYSHSLAWVSFAFSLCALLASLFKLYWSWDASRSQQREPSLTSSQNGKQRLYVMSPRSLRSDDQMTAIDDDVSRTMSAPPRRPSAPQDYYMDIYPR